MSNSKDKLRKFIGNFFYHYFMFPMRIAYKADKRLSDECMGGVCRAYEKLSNSYVRLSLKPKTVEQMHFLSGYSNVDYSEIGIVIQGPPNYSDDMTYNTIKLYNRMFPGIHIILSTWKDSADDAYTKKVESLGAIVLRNDKPEKSGSSNVNYQVKSSIYGLIKAQEVGCKYAIKTRTDQRMYLPESIDFLYSILSAFPPNAQNQKSRIVVLQGSNGSMFLPYYIEDMFYFGDIDEMIRLFSRPDDQMHINNRGDQGAYEKKIRDDYPLGKSYSIFAPQNLIMEEYAKKISPSYVDGTVKSYWRFMKDCLIGISVNQIGLFWQKHAGLYFDSSAWTTEYDLNDDDNTLVTYNWRFSNWYDLYTGILKYDPSFEKYQLRK